MKIDVELDDEETTLLLLMLGAGAGSLHLPIYRSDDMLAIVNKLMKDNPNYTPYDIRPKEWVN
jgi:hypothetical protein